MSRLTSLSRLIGRAVCVVRGHRYFYVNGSYCGWKAYPCVRCGEFDRPLNELEFRMVGNSDDYEDYEDYEQEDYQQALVAHAESRRWFRQIPFPRWL